MEQEIVTSVSVLKALRGSEDGSFHLFNNMDQLFDKRRFPYTYHPSGAARETNHPGKNDLLPFTGVISEKRKVRESMALGCSRGTFLPSNQQSQLTIGLSPLSHPVVTLFGPSVGKVTVADPVDILPFDFNYSQRVCLNFQQAESRFLIAQVIRSPFLRKITSVLGLV